MSDVITTPVGLWMAVVVSGIYHGVNPGMGWPLVVSAAMMDRGLRAFIAALGALSVGHFLAMIGILLPFAVMTAMVEWQQEIRIVAALIVVAFGVWRLFNRRHPRMLARIPPSRLALWSFLVATAHGAGLMLVPIYLGLCLVNDPDAGHRAAAALMMQNATLSVGVSVVHTASMILSGGAIAFVVYRWLGLSLLTKSWFDLDLVWALSLLVVGAIGLVLAIW